MENCPFQTMYIPHFRQSFLLFEIAKPWEERKKKTRHVCGMEQVGKYGASRFCIPALSEFDATMRGLPPRSVCVQGGRSSEWMRAMSDGVRIGEQGVWVGLHFKWTSSITQVLLHTRADILASTGHACCCCCFFATWPCKMYPNLSTFTGANSERRSQSRPCKTVLVLLSFFKPFFLVRLPAQVFPPPRFVPQERLLKLFIYRKEEVEGQDMLFFPSPSLSFSLSDLKRLFSSWSY